MVVVVGAVLSFGTSVVTGSPAAKQEPANSDSLPPRQMEIEKQRKRLSSGDVEERRDALTRLGSMHHKDASLVALPGLADADAMVKVTAAQAILALPAEEAARSLMPLVNDPDDFVRREVAYALGKTRSRLAVAPLTERLLTDKVDEVRGAAAVALGEIGDETAVSPLASILNPQLGIVPTKGKKKKKQAENPFVLRAAARSLGLIGSRGGLSSLIYALQDVQGESDVRRESAIALGAVGDSSALPSLREALTASDPYLSQAAQAAINKIVNSKLK